MMNSALRILLVTAALLFSSSAVQAHEFRTSFLEVQARDDLNYQLSWRLNIKDAGNVSSDWSSGPGCNLRLIGTSRSDSVEQRDYSLSCEQATALLTAPLIEGTPFDVLVKIIGRTEEARFEHLNMSQRNLWLDSASAAHSSGNSMLVEGAEHVLGGPDHLVYILLLFLFLRRRTSMLLLGITLFTLAHSLTLALSVMDVIRVPPAPVEAVIALTIAYFAAAIARGRQVGTESRTPSWAVIVVVCGLVHGLGFANSLSTVGLNGPDLAWNLLSFNVGIELAQIAVVSCAAFALRLSSAFRRPGTVQRVEYSFSVGAGALAVLWYMDRML